MRLLVLEAARLAAAATNNAPAEGAVGVLIISLTGITNDALKVPYINTSALFYNYINIDYDGKEGSEKKNVKYVEYKEDKDGKGPLFSESGKPVIESFPCNKNLKIIIVGHGGAVPVTDGGLEGHIGITRGDTMKKVDIFGFLDMISNIKKKCTTAKNFNILVYICHGRKLLDNLTTQGADKFSNVTFYGIDGPVSQYRHSTKPQQLGQRKAAHIEHFLFPPLKDDPVYLETLENEGARGASGYSFKRYSYNKTGNFDAYNLGDQDIKLCIGPFIEHFIGNT